MDQSYFEGLMNDVNDSILPGTKIDEGDEYGTEDLQNYTDVSKQYTSTQDLNAEELVASFQQKRSVAHSHNLTTKNKENEGQLNEELKEQVKDDKEYLIENKETIQIRKKSTCLTCLTYMLRFISFTVFFMIILYISSVLIFLADDY
ncbi:hypothetical protein QTN25_004760 [Entamoeba marina]